jgi:hypothetical protein
LRFHAKPLNFCFWMRTHPNENIACFYARCGLFIIRTPAPVDFGDCLSMDVPAQVAMTTSVDYSIFSKDDLLQLISRVRDSDEKTASKLDEIARSMTPTESPRGSTAVEPCAKKQKKLAHNQKLEKSFDFSKYQKRHVALKFSYIGEKYAGFARQDHMEVGRRIILST